MIAPFFDLMITWHDLLPERKVREEAWFPPCRRMSNGVVMAEFYAVCKRAN